jgi:hypothetical protein
MASVNKGLFIHPESGNVGIGTQFPTTEFQVRGNITPSTCNIYNLGSANLRFKDLYLSGNTIDIGGLQLSRGTTGGLDLKNEQGNFNSATFANVIALSNVGVGTTLFQQKLHVNGHAYISSNMLVFGNTGIGTTNPNGKLNIFNGTSQMITGLTPSSIHLIPASGTDGTTTGITWGSANGGGIDPNAQAGIIVQGKLNYGTTMSFLTSDNFTLGTKERITLLPNGNVGIGTTIPKATLDILGNVQVTGNIGNGTYIYDAYTKATNYTSINGTHGIDANTSYWHTYLHFSENDGRIGWLYNNTDGDTIASEWAEYAVPAGMKQAWLSHLPWSNCRYFDIYGKYADGTIIWLFRVNAYSAINTVANTWDHSGVTIVPICAVDRFTHIRIVGGRGRYHLMGFAWSKHDRQHNYGGHTGFIDVDNLVGKRIYIRGTFASVTGPTYITLISKENNGIVVTSSTYLYPPRAGTYLVGFNTILNNSAARNDVKIYKNDGAVSIATLSEDATIGFHYRGASIVFNLLTTDWIRYYCVSGTTYGDNEWTSFYMIYLF